MTGVPPLDLDGLKLSQLGQGAGMHGLPGDFTPPSRFIRESPSPKPSCLRPRPTTPCSRPSIFSISSTSRAGACAKTDGGLELTQWTTVSDIHNLRWYFKTYDDETIRVVDLKKAVAAANGQIRTIKMESEQPIVDASTTFMSGKQASDAEQ